MVAITGRKDNGSETAWVIDGSGHGHVDSVARPIQNDAARNSMNVYQVITPHVPLVVGINTILHLQNNSATHSIELTYFRFQAITAAAFPLSTDYFEMGDDTILTAGTGASIVSRNTNSKGVNSPVGVVPTAYDTVLASAPVTTGVFAPHDLQYPRVNGEELKYNKEGSAIIGEGGHLEFRYTSTVTGTAKLRVSFILGKNV